MYRVTRPGELPKLIATEYRNQGDGSPCMPSSIIKIDSLTLLPIYRSLPSFLVWAQWLSWYRYAYEILVVNQWDGVDSIECPAGEDLLAPVPAHFSYGLTYNYTGDPAPCTYPDGDSVIRLSGFDKDAVIFNVAMLFVMVLVLRVMAFLALFARSRRN